MELFEQKEIIKVSNNGSYIYKDSIILEEHYELWVNYKQITDFYCSPTKIKELAIGYIFTKAIINCYSDILEIELDEKRNIIQIITEKIITSKAVINKQQLSLRKEIIYNLAENLNTKSDLFQKTGSSHSVMLADANGEIFFAEDVARHNALDKIIGEMLIEGIGPQNKVLIFSGRVAIDMLRKVKRIQVKMIVAIGAPTYQAVNEAKKSGITICGFVRKSNMNIYTNQEQVIY